MEKFCGETEEINLIRLARAGDLSALRQIIDRHEVVVTSTIRGILGPGPDVDDIGQETFLRFFGSLNRFRGDARIGTYLVRIAVNLSINEIRRRKRDRRTAVESENTWAGPAVRNPGLRDHSSDAKALIQAALGRLEPRFRKVVVLRLIDGFSVRETVKILGLPQGTVLSRLSRAQDKLKVIVMELSKESGNSMERRES